MPAVHNLLIPFKFTNQGKGKAEISIRGTIGTPVAYRDYGFDAGGTLNDFERELKNLGNVDEIILRIFSRGGDIFTANAIHDVIAAHPARFVAIVDGLAASAATWLMNACDEIQMPTNAWYFMHNVQGGTYGDHREMRKAANEAEKFTGDLARVYQDRMRAAGKKNSVTKVREMMDAETWLNGTEAKDLGLVDTVLGEVALSASLPSLPIDYTPQNTDRIPASVRALFDTAKPIHGPNNPANSESNPMIKHRTPLMQAAEAGGTSGASPAPAPVVTPPAPAPVNQAPAAPAALPPAPGNNAPAAAPQASFSLADITNAITTAVAPLNDRLAKLEGQAAAGITPQNLAGAPPATNVAPPAADKPVGGLPENASPEQMFSFGLRQAMKNSATLPPPAASAK